MGYQIPVLTEYTQTYNAAVHVVHWDNKKLTPYIPPPIEGVTYYQRSTYNNSALKKLVAEIKPDIVYVSGWMDKDYLAICRILRKKDIPIVGGSDTQWRGGVKQTLGALFFRGFLKKTFSHLWVAGPYQFEYARKLGFAKCEIIFNCLSADVNLFKRVARKPIVPKKIVFIGRFEKVKGIKNLIAAWEGIEDKNGWELTFIGNGSLRSFLQMTDNVEVVDFLDPSKLSDKLSEFGILVLPSIKEPWALVIHEAMAAGLPVVATDICGAAPMFILPNYTGWLIKPNNVDNLRDTLRDIMNLSNERLLDLSNNARVRANVITPQLAAASFLSVLKK